MKYLIRAAMTLPVIIVFGFQGVYQLWQFGGQFSIHGKDYKEISEQALSLLRDLADLQNGPPLEQHRGEWKQVMEDVWAFLERAEKTNNE